MKRAFYRRRILRGAGIAVLAAFAGTSSAQPSYLQGTIAFADGVVIPRGDIELIFDDPTVGKLPEEKALNTRIQSDGKSKVVTFSVQLPVELIQSPSLRVVARLVRDDGWLLARGAARFAVNSPVTVTLNTAMY